MIQIQAVHGNGVQHHVDIQDTNAAHSGKTLIVEGLTEAEGQSKGTGGLRANQENPGLLVQFMEKLGLLRHHHIDVEILLPSLRCRPQNAFGSLESTVMVGPHAGEIENHVEASLAVRKQGG